MIMSWVGAAILVAGFVLLFKLFALVARSKKVFATVKESAAVMRDYQLTDLEKEKRLQAASIELFKGFFVIVVGSAIALLAPAGIVWGLDYYGWLSFNNTMALTLSWEFIVGVTILAFALYFLLRKPKNNDSETVGSTESSKLHSTLFLSQTDN